MSFVIQITEASAEKMKRKVLSLIIPFFNDFLYINLYDIVMNYYESVEHTVIYFWFSW